MSKNQHILMLERLGACDEAVAFAKSYGTLRVAWENCERPDWMLWLLRRIAYKDDANYRLFACWCVRNTTLNDGRKVWDLLTDERSKRVVELVENFAIGLATIVELQAARKAAAAAVSDANAAYAAANAANAAAYAANAANAAAAAYAAAYAAAANAAANAAAYAADAAAAAASYASYASYACVGVRKEAQKVQAIQLRSMFTWYSVSKQLDTFNKQLAYGEVI